MWLRGRKVHLRLNHRRNSLLIRILLRQLLRLPKIKVVRWVPVLIWRHFRPPYDENSSASTRESWLENVLKLD